MLNVNVNDVMENENKQTELMTTFKMISENGSGSYSDFFDEFYPNVTRYTTLYSDDNVLKIFNLNELRTFTDKTDKHDRTKSNKHLSMIIDLGAFCVGGKLFLPTIQQKLSSAPRAELSSSQKLSSAPRAELKTELPIKINSNTFKWYNEEIKFPSSKKHWFFTMESLVYIGMNSKTEEAKQFTKNFIAYTKRCEAGMKAGQDLANATNNMVEDLHSKGIDIYSLVDSEIFKEYIISKVKIKVLNQYTNEYYTAVVEELEENKNKLLERKRELDSKSLNTQVGTQEYIMLQVQQMYINANINTIDTLNTKFAQEHQKLTNTCKVNQSNQVKLLKNIIEEYKTKHNANTIYFKSESSAYDKLVKEGILENQKNGNKYTGNKIPGEGFDWMYGTVGTFQKRDKYGCQTPRFGQFGEDYLIYVMDAIDNNKPYETDLNKVEAILYGGK